MSSGSGQASGKLVRGRVRHAFLELEAAAAIGAFHKPVVPHIEVDQWVPVGPAAAVTGYVRCFDFDDLGWFYGHRILIFRAIDRAARRMIPKEHKQSMRFRV